MTAAAKIATRQEAAQRLDAVRETQTIVFTNGCFDILHPGHADLLARCKAQGDLLIVGVNTSESVRRLKGPTRPLNSTQDRLFVLASLESVDMVVPFEEDTPLELITLLRPHVLIKGGDWSVDNIVGRDVVEAGGGRVLSLPLLPGHSTTGLIEKILEVNKG